MNFYLSLLVKKYRTHCLVAHTHTLELPLELTATETFTEA